MRINRKKKYIEHLLNSFGKQKEETFNFELIERYFRNKNNSDSFQVISDKTCNDIDFYELFEFVDRTSSKVGQQFLYNKLRTIPFDNDIDESLIKELSNNHNLRTDIQQRLKKFNNTDSYYITSLFQDDYIKPPKWFIVVRLLSVLSLLFLVLTIIRPQLFLISLALFIVNLTIHYWNKKNVYQYLESIPQLLKLANTTHYFYKNENLKSINPDILSSIHSINKVRYRMCFFNLESNMQGDLSSFFWGILELVKIFFILEPQMLFSVLKQLDTKRKEIENVYVFLGKIDLLISIASLRKGLNYFCIPQINKIENGFLTTDIFHPLIENCISNTIRIKDKSILLTGSNMSGKTSFIRTIGINVLTGLTLNTCFAGSISFPRMKIFSAIRISDDLVNDRSYYFEEVLTVKNMIDNSRSRNPNLFLLDEIYKGTNTIERISAGKAVLSYLAKNNNIVLVSTHDIELTDLLEDEYELYHFSEIVNDKTIDFDYKLKEGKLKNRNAIKILEINNYPKEIIKEAIEISKRIDKITINSNIYKTLDNR